ncbi:MAG: FAD:protein FMN transferase [Clostridia bacterium]|nr:FAD:protein FMN transferase [Clostridia bacterium]MBR5428346.1 FAD:protein FMN transferase [Clostridia bacterium]
MQKSARNRRIVVALAVLLAAGLLAAVLWDAFAPKAEKQSATSFAMGSVLQIDIYGGEVDLCGEVRDAVAALDQRISRTVDNSYVSLLGKNGGCTADGDFADDMKAILALCEATGGAFDITIGALSDLWDVGGENPRVPSAGDISAALALTGYEKIESVGFRYTVPDGVIPDLGAAGKGMACDAAKKILATDGSVTGAVVSSGGSILCFGKNPEKGLWTVGVRDPDGGANDLAGVIRTGECFVSTSGNYEKYFELDGVRYCHILSPFDGYPVNNGLKSVTVRCDGGMASDALSTACFVLGEEKSLPVLSSFGADAIFIYGDNTVSVTDGLAEDFELTNGNYRLREK